MSIIDKAKELAQQEKAKHHKELSARLATAATKELFVQTAINKLYRYLVAEFNGQHDFGFVLPDISKRVGDAYCGVNDEILTIIHTSERGRPKPAVGTVYVKMETLNETPEQKNERMVFVLSDEYAKDIVYAHATCDKIEDIDQSLHSFGDSIANHLKTFF